MKKIILLLFLVLIYLMGIACVSAVDVADNVVDDSAVCVLDVDDSVARVSDVDAYDCAEDDHIEQQLFDANSSIQKSDNYGGELDKYVPIVNFNNGSDSFSLISNYQVLQIEKRPDGKKLDVKLCGRLDIKSANEFESLNGDLDNVEELTFDFKGYCPKFY